MTTDPQRALEELYGKATDRQYRLFAVAVCRRIWPLLTLPRSRQAVEVSERHADGQAGDKELQAAHQVPAWLGETLVPPWAVPEAAEAAAANAAHADAPEAALRASLWALDAAAGAAANAVADPSGPAWRPAFRAAKAAEKQAQARLVACIFHAAPAVPPSWRDAAAARLARSIYDNRAFDRMSALADALQKAGCADAEVLAHCRSGGPHGRGCWILDLLLAKE